MRVIIDGRALQGGSSVRGIGTYTRGLLSGIAELGRLADIAVLLQIGPSPPELQQVTIDAVARRVAVVQPTLQRMLDPILVARALRDERADVFHSVDLVQPWRATMPAVVTVHDLIPFRFPQWYRWARRSRLPALRRLRHAQRIIAVSHATARDVSYFAGVDPDAITVVPEGVSPRFTRAGDSEIASVCATYGV
ncbi:MAG: glycosyltransferase, partial [Candidatus Dormibacteraeota bacterium]|nr:glycosyltransferase [Candidatus Dormibacteraeota bacterium]